MPTTRADGERFVTFHNTEPGIDSFALQGFAIDGRKVPLLQITYEVRGRDLVYGQQRERWPIILTFYDDRRAVVGEEHVGPVAGTFDWQRESQIIRVPLAAREAIVRVGLMGGSGELSLDDLQLTSAQ